MGKRELVVGEENVIHLPLLLKVFFSGNFVFSVSTVLFLFLCKNITWFIALSVLFKVVILG